MCIRTSHGCGGRGNSYPALPYVCGSGHGASGAQPEKQYPGKPVVPADPSAGYDQKDPFRGNSERPGKWHVPVWKDCAAESGFHAGYGIYRGLCGSNKSGDVPVSAGGGAWAGPDYHCGPVCGCRRAGAGEGLHEKSHCGKLRTAACDLHMHGIFPESGGRNL